MKNFTNLIRKKFGNKVIVIPPSLRQKNTVKPGPQKYNTAIKYLLRGERYAEGHLEKHNNELKEKHMKNVYQASKKMLNQLYVIHSTNTLLIHSNAILKIKNLIKSILSIEEMNILISHITEAQEHLSDDINKNEAILKVFLDKIEQLTPNSDINNEFISYFSDINLKEFEVSSLYKDYFANNSNETNFENSINYMNICNKFDNFLFRNVVVENETNPESQFKDTFLLKNEFKFIEPILIQRNPQKTKFDKSNFIYYDKMPLVYPINSSTKDKKSKEDNEEYNLTQLNNELLIKYSIDPRKNLRDFNQRFLERSLQKYFKAEIHKPEIFMTTDSSSGIGLVNTDLLDESIEFINQFMKEDLKEEMQLLESNKQSEVVQNYKVPTFKVNNSDMIENENYLKVKKQDINNILKKSAKSHYFTKGFIEFSCYEEKQKFLTSAMNIFGLHVCNCKVEFYDADFCNLVEVKLNVPSFNKNIQGINPNLSLKVRNNSNLNFVSVQEVLNLINYQLKIKNVNRDLFIQPEYLVPSLLPREIEIGKSIYLRTNSFEDTLIIKNALNLPPLTNMLSPKINKPQVKYYNEHFISAIDIILKNTIANFDSILSVDSDYVKNK